MGINVTKLDSAWKILVQKAESGMTLTHGLLTGRLGIVLLQKPMHGKRVAYFHPTWFGEWPDGSRWPFFKGKFMDVTMKGQTAKEWLKFMDELTNHPNVLFVQAKGAFSDVPELKGKYPINLWSYPDPLGGAALKQISPEYNTGYIVVVPIRKTNEKMDTGIIKDGGQGVVEYVAPTSVNFVSVRTFGPGIESVDLKPLPTKLPPIIIEDPRPLPDKILPDPKPLPIAKDETTIQVIGTNDEKEKLQPTETNTGGDLKPQLYTNDGLPPVKQTDQQNVLQLNDLSQKQLSGKEQDGVIKEEPTKTVVTAPKYPLPMLLGIAGLFLLGTWFVFRK